MQIFISLLYVIEVKMLKCLLKSIMKQNFNTIVGNLLF